MKTIKIQSWIIIILLSISSTCAFAQSTKIDVNGLVVDKQYTHQQIVEKLGNPTKIDSWKNDDGYIDATYYYQSNTFGFSNDGVFDSFNIVDYKFKILNGQVKVGDNTSKLQTIPNCQFRPRSQYWPNDPSISDLTVSDYDMPILVGHKNGYITSLVYSTPM